MKVLLLDDDFYHPGNVAEQGVKPLEKAGFEFEILRDGADFTGKSLTGTPVVMLVKSDERTALDQSKWMTPGVRDALQNYVRGGGGLLAVHSGTVYGGMEDLHTLLGGVFVAHPAQLPVLYKPKANHPLTRGAQAFTATEEHYFMDMADEPLDVFLWGSSRHGELPAGWRRMDGRGRVCTLTPGHNPEVWGNPNFQQMLENALNWCAGE